LDCERGPLLAQIDFERDGRVKAVEFRSPDDARCSP
jgi:hypothetical protein